MSVPRWIDACCPSPVARPPSMHLSILVQGILQGVPGSGGSWSWSGGSPAHRGGPGVPGGTRGYQGGYPEGHPQDTPRRSPGIPPGFTLRDPPGILRVIPRGPPGSVPRWVDACCRRPSPASRACIYPSWSRGSSRGPPRYPIGGVPGVPGGYRGYQGSPMPKTPRICDSDNQNYELNELLGK